MITPTHSNSTALPWPRWLIGWAQALWPARATPQTVAATPVAATVPTRLTLQESLPPGQPTVVCLAVQGELNRHTYAHLIEIAQAHYRQGKRGLVLDLRQTTQIELSGLFALLSIARLYSGDSLLDPEDGWAGLRRVAESATPALGERVKLLAPSPAAATTLQGASFCQYFTPYADLETALAAFPKEQR